ncbi:MAG: hypothetical protein JWR26_2039 [Pedosphaera sp.]|nr:hypothetical protein [Pedosphaera sp.]
MAEGVGFEPTVGLLLLLISSQVPLTTQPPFPPLIIKHLRAKNICLIDNLLLPSDTQTVKSQNSDLKSKLWQSTKHTNLKRYIPNGVYHAKVRIKGKLIRRSLETNSITVALLRLADLQKEEQRRVASRQALVNGEMTFGQALEIYKQRLESNPELKPKSKIYRRERIAALEKSWPALHKMNVRKITKTMCLEWAGDYFKKFSSTNYNNTVGTLQGVLDIAKEAGALYDNHASHIRRVAVRNAPPEIPQTLEIFQQLFEHVKHQSAADLIRFMAYSGVRLSEAAKVTWSDVDLTRGTMLVRGDEETATKNGEVRSVPIIDEMKVLLERIQSERPERKPKDAVMTRKSCQGSIDTSCRKVGIPRFTHHDLRHYFITRCIQLTIDVSTIAEWVGHKDKGVLILKTYAHVLRAHSLEMAKRITFSPAKPANIIALPEVKAA